MMWKLMTNANWMRDRMTGSRSMANSSVLGSPPEDHA